MGLFIKGMKMPETCFNCPAHEWYDFGGENHGYQCPILRTTKAVSNVEARSKRRDNCPMIDVPPHGRLIDANALCRTLRTLSENEYTPEVFANWIDTYTDTIIPADLAEEDE